MFKTFIALAVILGTATGALAQTKRYSTNPSHDVFVNGKYVGSDPDPTIRSMLSRDSGND